LIGYIISPRRHYTERFPDALRDLSKWISEGRIIRNFHVVEGLEKAPEAFNMLFTGGNTGKLFVLAFSCSANFAALTPRFLELYGFLDSMHNSEQFKTWMPSGIVVDLTVWIAKKDNRREKLIVTRR
jgi:hypothetical protein